MSRTLALITGASSGIGTAYARQLAVDHDFVLVARRKDRLDDLADELRSAGATVEVLPADLATPEGLGTVAKRAAVGDIRLLICNAGAAGYTRLTEIDPDEIDRMLRLNAVAPVQLVRAALPGMLDADEGTVITIASLLAFSAGQKNPPVPRTLYTAAKSATLAFMRTLSLEIAGTGVRTQVVCPGLVATEFYGGYGNGNPTAMTAEDMVRSSLAGLRLGESICSPALVDQTAALDALLAAETALMAGGSGPSPAARYQEKEPTA
ncbi:SDR family NAD(P)-dependent oxidoreductase [Streptomyces sp. T028]|uniref:SDR family NAD(P)-dependent oxidoreductase n=1 Tax=Streptomyces sp. T028 TaxID=3394379 RepID=UPI003A85BF32